MFRTRIHFSILFLATIALLFSCDRSGAEKAEAPVKSAAECTPPPEQPAGTRTMLGVLAELRSRLDAAPDMYQNSAVADRMGAMLLQVRDPQQRVQMTFRYAQELLQAGRTREAIDAVMPIAQGMEQMNMPPESRRAVMHIVALGYLRLGEQANCLKNHNNESCILPLSERARHVDQEGSRKAIQIYESILDEFPDDLTARWLLNIACMTVGAHPSAVPPQWLIPESAFGPADGFPHFTDRAMELGFHDNDQAGGSCMEDFNNDGFLDIIASSWSLKQNVRLYLSDGAGGFSDATAASGLTGITGGLNMVHADYDNDGWMDVLVLRGGWLDAIAEPNSLLHNLGNGKFEDVTKVAGMFKPHRTQTAAWGDFDNDGWLDLMVGNESTKDTFPCEFYRNNGNGTFSEMATAAGIDVIGFVKAVAAGDVDNDGDLDLYFSNCTSANRLFLNTTTGGKIHFSEVPDAGGAALPNEGFPAWFFDYNNDGWLDIYAGSFPRSIAGKYSEEVAAYYLGLPLKAPTPRLYLNDHNGGFRDVTKSAGLDRPIMAMGSNFGDLDNNGFPDLCFGTGEPDYRSAIPNLLFANDGKGHFRDVTRAAGFGNIQKGHGIALGDIDRDGDLDMYANLGGAFEGDGYQDQLLENPTIGSTLPEAMNHWVTLVLEGRQSARCAIGARLRVTVRTANGTRDIHTVVGTGGSFGSSSLQQEIGLGDATAIVQVEVIWPVGQVKQVYKDVPMDRVLKLVEGQAAAMPLERPAVKLHPVKGAEQGHVHPSS